MDGARREDVTPAKADLMTYQYFSHEIDTGTHFCVKCGRFLLNLQESQRWDGNEVHPTCIEAENVSAISHMVRKSG
jgi:hypothetical protein